MSEESGECSGVVAKVVLEEVGVVIRARTRKD